MCRPHKTGLPESFNQLVHHSMYDDVVLSLVSCAACAGATQLSAEGFRYKS
jgi:hypothetical protein